MVYTLERPALVIAEKYVRLLLRQAVAQANLTEWLVFLRTEAGPRLQASPLREAEVINYSMRPIIDWGRVDMEWECWIGRRGEFELQCEVSLSEPLKPEVCDITNYIAETARIEFSRAVSVMPPAQTVPILEEVYEQGRSGFILSRLAIAA